MDWFNWVVMPILIFCARIIDMTLGTMRIIAVNQGKKNVAPIIGFFEVLVWVIVIRQLITTMENPIWFIAYAAGFAAGTYIGIYMAEKFSNNNHMVRIITKNEGVTLAKKLDKEGFETTLLSTDKRSSKKNIILLHIKSKDLERTTKLIQKYNPEALYTITDARKVSDGLMPHYTHEPRKGNIFKAKILKHK